MIRISVLLTLLAGLLCSGMAVGENRVYVDVVHSGNLTVPKDTIFIGGEYRLRIWMENDFLLNSFWFGFHIWSDYGEFMTWVSQPDGLGLYGRATLVPGCRMESDVGPDGTCWDLGGLTTDFQVWIGEASPLHTLYIGGCSMDGGVEPGPLEPMMNLHFRTTFDSWESGLIGEICVDSGQMAPPSNYALIYNFPHLEWVIPEADVPRCWPVKLKCGDPTGDGDINVSDAVFIINYIFKGGPAPDPWQLGDANADGIISIGDVVYLLRAIFSSGPQPECPDVTP